MQPMFWTLNILSVFLMSVLMAGVMIPQILLIAFRKNLFDEPDVRKIHTSAVPRLGGLAFMPVIFISIGLMLGVELWLGLDNLAWALINASCSVTFAFCALFILYIVGLADDLIGVRYRAKFVVQLVCAAMLIAGGLSVSNFYGFLWIYGVPAWIEWPFTLVLAIFIINAINLIDGIDGLASGLSSVAVIVYGTIFIMAKQYLWAMVAAATLGVLVPFFYYNVFGNPQKQKKIFMGDTGSLTIGLILCVLSFKLLNTPQPYDHKAINMLIAAMSPLVIPCFDVVRVYFYRIRHGNNPFLPDKNHIHHKLLALGMNQRSAMLSIVAASVLFTLFNIVLSSWWNVNVIILIDVVAFAGAMMLLPKVFRWLRRSKKA